MSCCRHYSLFLRPREALAGLIRSGTNWDGDGLRCGFSGGCGHVAMAVKDRSGFDHNARAMNLAGNNSAGLNLDFALRVNLSIEPPADDYAIPVNLAFDRCVLAENQRILGDKRSLHR